MITCYRCVIKSTVKAKIKWNYKIDGYKYTDGFINVKPPPPCENPNNFD